MATIHRTTLTPSKLELLNDWLPSRPWYRGTGREPALTKAGGFRLDDPAGEVGIEFMAVADGSGAQPMVYHVPLTYRAGPLEGAAEGLIGTAEHGVLGRRWVYDGTRDPVLVTQLVALIQGDAEPQAQSQSDTPDPTVLSHPATRAALTPARFAVSDEAEGTQLRIGIDGTARLFVLVRRVLEPAAGDESGRGYLTATWRLPDEATIRRGVFATAELR
jgi:hypothetical protein